MCGASRRRLRLDLVFIVLRFSGLMALELAMGTGSDAVAGLIFSPIFSRQPSGQFKAVDKTDDDTKNAAFHDVLK